MATKKADQAGVSPRAARQAVSRVSILELIRIKMEELGKSRANRRRAQQLARKRAAVILGVSPKVSAAPKPKSEKPVPPAGESSRAQRWLFWALASVLLLVLVWSGLYLLTNLPQDSGALVASATATPTALMPLAAPAEAESPTPELGEAVLYQLRVETQWLVSAARGSWEPMAAVGIYLTPFRNSDAGPDLDRDGTLRQETALETTVDGVAVALTTFSAPTGLYWVVVDEATLPSGCAVWVPELEADAAAGISLSRWKIVGIRLNGDDTATVEKFQIVCGLPTPTPGVPSATPPTEPPRFTPTPTGTIPPTTPPPPTATPEPTPTPTESCGPDCLEPLTPVPTPTEYPPDVPTPTPVR